jgi:hypothetical protein
LAAALRLALALDGGVLPIQGPPGSGKTYTGARMITAMANAGLRVGVTANSHKVVRNLLDGVRQASDELGLDLPCIQKISEPTPDEPGLKFATERAPARKTLSPRRSRPGHRASLTLAANMPIVDGLAPDRGRILKDFPYYGSPYTAEEQVGVTPRSRRPRSRREATLENDVGDQGASVGSWYSRS